MLENCCRQFTSADACKPGSCSGVQEKNEELQQLQAKVK